MWRGRGLAINLHLPSFRNTKSLTLCIDVCLSGTLPSIDYSLPLCLSLHVCASLCLSLARSPAFISFYLSLALQVSLSCISSSFFCSLPVSHTLMMQRYIISLLYSYFSQSLSRNSYSAPCSLVSTRGRF